MIKKKIILIYFLLSFFSVQAAENNKYFKQGVELFKNNKLDEAKISFEKDIVRNTKNKESYLYISKIYKNKNDALQGNLTSSDRVGVILLKSKSQKTLKDLIEFVKKNTRVLDIEGKDITIY